MKFPHLREYLAKLPAMPGVYLMYDTHGQILYIGKAKCLKKRVKSYFQKATGLQAKIALMVSQVQKIETIETTSEIEALLLEGKMIHELQPKYNTRQKDDKSYPYIVISKEDFPRVFVAHLNECTPPEAFEFLGPFVDSIGLRASLKLLQKVFRFRSCDLSLSAENPKYFRPCLLAFIHYCTAPCARRISKEEYANQLESFKKFLQSNHKEFVENLRQKMATLSLDLKFEEAAQVRDQIAAIESLKKRPLQRDLASTELGRINPRGSLVAAQKILGLSQLPSVIEGIDIAHHSGKEAVGSLVTFVDGLPYKEGYRRYKIRSKSTDDDYLMLSEVLTRRFCGQDKDRKLPDILLIDGGKGQLSSAMSALDKIGIQVPAVVGLAKKKEEIYLPGQTTPLAMPKNSLLHLLLCHVRDEAHRFAQKYHHHLKRKQHRPQ